MSCDAPHVGLLPLETARRRLCEAEVPLTGARRRSLYEATGLVLAEPVEARRDMPGVDTSAMDGYALRRADLAAGDGLPVAQRIPAGGAEEPLAPGCCARIFTGAPLPPGADCVVPQERTRLDDRGWMHPLGEMQEGANIRRRGEEYRRGSRLLEAGTRLDPVALALLAGQGVTSVTVRPRVRVALLSTGDELIEPGGDYRPGRVYDSNGVMLHALLEGQGCAVLDLGIVADTPEALRAAFVTARDNADLVICTGGVSVGEEDHVRPVLESLGRLVFHGVAMKPGKPFAFGYLGETPLIGLPGNPVASLVGWQLLALPFVQGCQGRPPAELQRFPVPAGFSRRANPGRCELLRVVLEWRRGEAVARLAGGQGSAMLRAAREADGYLMIEAGMPVEEGRDYTFLPAAQFLA